MLVRPELNSRPPAWQPGAQPTEPPLEEKFLISARPCNILYISFRLNCRRKSEDHSSHSLKINCNETGKDEARWNRTNLRRSNWWDRCGTIKLGRHEGSCCRDMFQRQRGVLYPPRRHALGSCSGNMQQGLNHNICTHMKMLRVHVSGICCSDCMSPRVIWIDR